MNKNFIRIIPKLDIKNNNLIKGVNLEGLRALGDPYDFAQVYSQHGADEICYIDNVATLYGTNNLTKFVSKTAMNLRIPLSVGGGIRSIDDISKMLHAGADKVAINSVLVDDINFLKKAIKIFGSSTITVIVECIKIKNRYFISKSNGRDLVNENPLDWCKKLEDLGAGELFITSVNHEGLKNGFDIPLIKKISKKSSIPIIAHGGAGNFEHIWDVIRQTNISGVSIAGFFHYNYLNNFKIKKNNMIGNFNFVSTEANKKKTNLIKNLKKFLKKRKINVR
jgi:cyclase